MREIDTGLITDLVEELCITANYELPSDVMDGLRHSAEKEESEIGRDIIGQLIQNAEWASKKGMAICQDTGMAVFFVEIGQDVVLKGPNITEAINEGVRRGYKKGYLRNSIVEDPILRKNTGDNTPAVIYYDIVEGDKITIHFSPKGFGSENMSAIKMLSPSHGLQGIMDFVVETVDKAGSNPCPPIVVGVGIGGTMDKAAMLSKKALLRPINIRNPKEHIRKLEEELLERINNLGIGPQGLGGRITALAVNIETYPTHIAGLPVAVNISCHATRHVTVVL